jgi:hypothetical protein
MLIANILIASLVSSRTSRSSMTRTSVREATRDSKMKEKHEKLIECADRRGSVKQIL